MIARTPYSLDEHHEKLSVLVPVYNEEDTVGIVLRRLLDLGGIVKEIIVVDDGSQDYSAYVVRTIARLDSRVKLFQLAENVGKTGAIRKALSEATGDIIIIQDADLEYDSSEILDVITPILDGEADVVFGSRFLNRSRGRVQYFYHYLANLGLTMLSNLLTNRNMSDIETCYKAFRSEVIKPLQLKSRGFGMEVEITAMVCKSRARIYEVPISYNGRTYKEGKKIGFRDGVMAGLYIFWFNLVQTWFPSTKQYLATVNNALKRRPVLPPISEEIHAA